MAGGLANKESKVKAEFLGICPECTRSVYNDGDAGITAGGEYIHLSCTR